MLTDRLLVAASPCLLFVHLVGCAVPPRLPPFASCSAQGETRLLGPVLGSGGRRYCRLTEDRKGLMFEIRTDCEVRSPMQVLIENASQLDKTWTSIRLPAVVRSAGCEWSKAVTQGDLKLNPSVRKLVITPEAWCTEGDKVAVWTGDPACSVPPR